MAWGCLIGLGLLLGAAAGLLWLGPNSGWFVNWAERQAKEAGVEVALDRISWRPMSGLRVEGVRWLHAQPDAGWSAHAAKFDAIEVDWTISDLLATPPTIQRVALRGAHLALRVDDEGVSWARAANPPSRTPTVETTSPAGPSPWPPTEALRTLPIRIREWEVGPISVRLRDDTSGKAFDLSGLCVSGALEASARVRVGACQGVALVVRASGPGEERIRLELLGHLDISATAGDPLAGQLSLDSEWSVKAADLGIGRPMQVSLGASLALDPEQWHGKVNLAAAGAATMTATANGPASSPEALGVQRAEVELQVDLGIARDWLSTLNLEAANLLPEGALALRCAAHSGGAAACTVESEALHSPLVSVHDLSVKAVAGPDFREGATLTLSAGELDWEHGRVEGTTLLAQTGPLDAEFNPAWASLSAHIHAAEGRPVDGTWQLSEAWLSGRVGQMLGDGGRRYDGTLKLRAQRAGLADAIQHIELSGISASIEGLKAEDGLPRAPEGSIWFSAERGAFESGQVTASGELLGAGVRLQGSRSLAEGLAADARMWAGRSRAQTSDGSLRLAAFRQGITLQEGSIRWDDLALSSATLAWWCQSERAGFQFPGAQGSLRRLDWQGSLAPVSGADMRLLTSLKLERPRAAGRQGPAWLAASQLAVSAQLDPRGQPATWSLDSPWRLRADFDAPGTRVNLDADNRGRFALQASAHMPGQVSPILATLPTPWAVDSATSRLDVSGAYSRAGGSAQASGNIDLSNLRPKSPQVPAVQRLTAAFSGAYQPDGATEAQIELDVFDVAPKGLPHLPHAHINATMTQHGDKFDASIQALLAAESGSAESREPALSLSATASQTGAGARAELTLEVPSAGAWKRWIPADVVLALPLQLEPLQFEFAGWATAPSLARLAQPKSASATAKLQNVRLAPAGASTDAPSTPIAMPLEVNEILVQAELAKQAAPPSSPASVLPYTAALSLDVPRVQQGKEMLAQGISLRAIAKPSPQSERFEFTVRGAAETLPLMVPFLRSSPLTFIAEGSAQPGGPLQVTNASLHNGSGGTQVTIHSAIAAPGTPGEWESNVSATVEQDLSALVQTDDGPTGDGFARIQLELSSPRGITWRAKALAGLQDASLKWPAVGLEFEGADGTVPVVQDLLRTASGWERLPGPLESPYAALRFADLQPFFAREHFISLRRLQIGAFALGPLAGNPRVEWNVAAFDQLQAELWGGNAVGRLDVTLDLADPVVSFMGRVGGLRPAGREPLDANAQLRLRPARLDAEGRVHILRLSRAHLDALLRNADPHKRNPAVQKVRSALALGFPKAARLVAEHGFLTLRVELGGLAELVSLDDIRGLPVGPLLQRIGGGDFFTGGEGEPAGPQATEHIP